jgi:hypothetical protein
VCSIINSAIVQFRPCFSRFSYTLWLRLDYYTPKKDGLIWGNRFHIKWAFGTQDNQKHLYPELPFWSYQSTALPIWSILHIFKVYGLDRQCCLAGSSKTAPRILISSIAMVADYSFELNSIDWWFSFDKNDKRPRLASACDHLWPHLEIKWKQ